MKITLDHIMEFAKEDPFLLLKGSSLYRQGRIQDVDITLIDDDVIDVAANVRDAENVYFPRIQVSEEGLCFHNCSCAEYRSLDRCRHVIALLYKYMYELYDDEIAHLIGQVNDPLANQMIEAYLKKSLEGTGVSSGLCVQLLPTLHLGDEITLSFRIGLDRPYIVKDIDALLTQIENEEMVSYGKKLAFQHSLSNFDLLSQRLIHLLKKRRDEMRSIFMQMKGIYSTQINLSMKKDVILTSMMLDEFMELFAGKEIPVADGDFELMYHVLDENPKIHVELVEQGKDYYLCKSEPYRYFTGYRRHYVAEAGTIYRLDEQYRHDMQEFLQTLQSNRFHLKLRKKNMSAFYSSVLPIIQSHLNLNIQADLSEYVPVPLTPRIYFDVYGSAVSADLRFVYDGKEIPMNDDGNEPHRNVAEEKKAKILLEKYFPKQMETGLFIMEEDGEIYSLVSQGLDELSSFCELYYSEAFRNIKVRPSPMMSAGVRLSEGLLHLSIDLQDFDPKELRQLLSAYRAKKRFYRAKDGSFLQLDQGSLSSLSDLMDGFHLNEKDILKKEITIPQYRAMQMDAFIKSSEQIKFERDAAFKKLIRDFYSVSDSDFAIDPSLKPILRNYQKSGFRWLKTIASYQFGGILADDMGLGKTLQIITLLKDARKEYEEKKKADDSLCQPISLVVTPASLVLNWQKELERFTPDLKVLVIMGGIAQRHELIESVLDYDVVLTSYDLLKRDVELYQNYEFYYQIVDEAQYIKNPHTQAAKAVKKIKSIHRFALSGTPVENSLAELWSIFDFLMPGYLYPYHYFKEHFETPIVKENDEEALTKLRRMVQPFVLRRLKKDVLKELPSKVETTMYCQMEDEQRKLYVANAMEMSRNLSSKLETEGIGQNKIMVLSLLTRLRQLCCHPKLCYDNYNGPSAKLDTCMELVRSSLEGKHQVLIFSSFTSMLDLIKIRLEEEGIPYFELTGATSAFKRMELVTVFQNGAVPVFLISLKAGGTGLNLTAADVVIHFDPWWNISAQNQATDRTHRIGQRSNVNVYNLIAKDTIEEKILVLQEKKRSLADAIVEEGGNLISTMSKEDILALFEV